MRLAAIQYAPVFKNREANLKTAVTLATMAAEAGANIIVLPELCTTGYSFMSYEDAKPYAEEVGGFETGYSRSNPPSSMFAMKKIVDRYGVAIVWGVMEISGVNKTNALHNSQVLLKPDGFVSYQKINPWGNDFLWGTPGTASPPITTFKGKRVGLLICRDVRDKGDKGTGLTDFYEKGDADIVCFSSNFGSGGFPSTSWVKFAQENKVWFVVSNRYGQEIHNDFGHGGICIVEPQGKVHCEGLKWNEPCIVYADVP
jgi:predicted amidohydrolase